MKLILVTVALLGAGTAVAQKNDWIVSGPRLGPITAETSRPALVQLFGENNVNDEEVDAGEGPEAATVVFGKDPSAAFAIVWQDNRISAIYVCFKSEFGPCKWHTRNGATLGTSVSKLERLNGRPFVIQAWGSDVGGNIIDWNEGRLASEFGRGGPFKLWLTLNWRQPSGGPTPQQWEPIRELDRLKRNPSSNDSAVRKLYPIVDRIRLIVE